MGECIDVMDGVFRAMSSGEAILPLRQAVWQPDRKGLLVTMPAYLGSPRAIGGKFITVFNGNLGSRFESHQGAVLLFDCEQGQLLAIVDAATITRVRTAAASGAATRVLARRDARDLAILGSGTQASSHLQAMHEVRHVERVRVWSRNAGHARRFAEKAGAGGVSVDPMGSVQEAVADADVICTTTASTEPVLMGRWLSPGTHVNAVGASQPGFRELDSEVLAACSLYTDRRESLYAEADDFRVPLREGKIDSGRLKGEMGEVLAGEVLGRTSESEITVFKSLGVAAEDVASAHHVYTEARRRGLGTWVDFSAERGLGGDRQDRRHPGVHGPRQVEGGAPLP